MKDNKKITENNTIYNYNYNTVNDLRTLGCCHFLFWAADYAWVYGTSLFKPKNWEKEIGVYKLSIKLFKGHKYRVKIFDTQPWDTLNSREISHGRVPFFDSRTISLRSDKLKGRPFTYRPPKLIIINLQ